MPTSKTARTLIAPVSNAAGATMRGTIGLQTVYGGLLTMKITNGAIAPSVQCVGRVLIAHNAVLPVAGPAGADWKTLFSFGGGVVANTVTENHFIVDASVMALEVEFTGNTGQAVIVEAFLSELTTV